MSLRRIHRLQDTLAETKGKLADEIKDTFNEGAVIRFHSGGMRDSARGRIITTSGYRQCVYLQNLTTKKERWVAVHDIQKIL